MGKNIFKTLTILTTLLFITGLGLGQAGPTIDWHEDAPNDGDTFDPDENIEFWFSHSGGPNTEYAELWIDNDLTGNTEDVLGMMTYTHTFNVNGDIDSDTFTVDGKEHTIEVEDLSGEYFIKFDGSSALNSNPLEEGDRQSLIADNQNALDSGEGLEDSLPGNQDTGLHAHEIDKTNEDVTLTFYQVSYLEESFSETGSYDIQVESYNDNLFTSTRTVNVEEEPPSITLNNPLDNEVYSYGEGPGFDITVDSGDTGIDEGYIYVLDSSGTEVEQFDLQSIAPGNTVNYERDLNDSLKETADVYEWYVELEYNTMDNGDVVQSEFRSFTIEEPDTPVITLDQPADNTVYSYGEGPGFEWTVETFDTGGSIELVVEDSTGTEVQRDGIASQLENSVNSYSWSLDSEYQTNPDNYNWFVEVDYGSSREFTETSETRTFEVEDLDSFVGFNVFRPEAGSVLFPGSIYFEGGITPAEEITVDSGSLFYIDLTETPTTSKSFEGVTN